VPQNICTEVFCCSKVREFTHHEIKENNVKRAKTSALKQSNSSLAKTKII
jgi:hypothetical protein